MTDTPEQVTQEPEIQEPEVQGPTISDLVIHAIDQKPLEFQKTFYDLLQDRIEDSIYNRKLEIASVFSSTEDEEGEPEGEVKPEVEGEPETEPTDEVQET